MDTSGVLAGPQPPSMVEPIEVLGELVGSPGSSGTNSHEAQDSPVRPFHGGDGGDRDLDPFGGRALESTVPVRAHSRSGTTTSGLFARLSSRWVGSLSQLLCR